MRLRGVGVWLAIAGSILGADILGAAAQPARPAPTAPTPAPPAPAKPADPSYEAARTAFEALPESERKAVQDALVWTGRYASVSAGTFGRRTFDAIAATQRAAGQEPTGILADKDRAALLAAGRKARDAAGFAVRKDAATGVAIGVPKTLLPRESRVPTGTRWQSADGRATLETRAFAPGETDLQATFDRVAASTPERKVTYKLKRPDFLVVSGETPTGRFYIRYADTPAGLRGFTFGYDKALSPDIDRIVIAIANSFEPVAGAAPPAPAASAAANPTPGLSAVAPTLAPAVPLGTGIVVAPGRVLTSAAALGDCATPRVGTAPAKLVASDAGRTLALLDVAGTAKPAGLAPGPAPAAGASLVALAADVRGAALATPTEATSPARLVAPLQPGAAGAPVLDRSGRLVGLVASYPKAPRLVAGTAMPTGYDLVPAAAVAAFLSANGIASTPAVEPERERSVGEIAGPLAPAIRPIACGS